MNELVECGRPYTFRCARQLFDYRLKGSVGTHLSVRPCSQQRFKSLKVTQDSGQFFRRLPEPILGSTAESLKHELKGSTEQDHKVKLAVALASRNNRP